MRLFNAILLFAFLSDLNYISYPQTKKNYTSTDSVIKIGNTTKVIKIPKKILSGLVEVDIRYWGYDSKIHEGKIIMNRRVAEEAKIIFLELLNIKFPIESIKPVSYFNWDDDSSMYYNNTSGFNYRKTSNGKSLSKHAFGFAIDINPRENYCKRNNRISPVNGTYDSKVKGTILRNSAVLKIFVKYGWTWGGNWRSLKDYQHFEKKSIN